MLVVFEGIDGSGKTTLIKTIHDHFKQQLKPVYKYSHPNQNFARSAVNSTLDPLTKMLLTAADCNEMFAKTYENHQDTDIVLLDRIFTISGYAYSGYGDRLIEMNEKLFKNLFTSLSKAVAATPDLVIFMHPVKEVVLQRLLQRKKVVKAFEKIDGKLITDNEYFDRVYNAYEVMISEHKSALVLRGESFNSNLQHAMHAIETLL